MAAMEEAGDAELVVMGLRVSVSPVQIAFYIILVLLGILGNATVIGLIGQSVLKERGGGGRNSDIIIVNTAVSNLLVSRMRNMLLFISDMGLQLYSSKEWYQFLMGICVAAVGQRVVNTLPQCIPPADIEAWLPLWGTFTGPETLMLVSSTTRPLLGCIWNFPSSFTGLAYATTSMVIHETIPIILMAFTNVGSLNTLYVHGRMRSSMQDAPVIKRVPAERRAAKVILALIMLFIASWETSIISVNYFNYNRGSLAEFLLVIARFANIIFIAMSLAVLAVGHRRLRSSIKSALTH